MMYDKDQKAVRQLLDIDDSEMITMFIAVGELVEEPVVPVSDRNPAESFVRRRSLLDRHPSDAAMAIAADKARQSRATRLPDDH